MSTMSDELEWNETGESRSSCHLGWRAELHFRSGKCRT
jgi:hypothetical protein